MRGRSRKGGAGQGKREVAKRRDDVFMSCIALVGRGTGGGAHARVGTRAKVRHRLSISQRGGGGKSLSEDMSEGVFF